MKKFIVNYSFLVVTVAIFGAVQRTCMANQVSDQVLTNVTQNDQPVNGTSEGRQSRQLWNFVKNVIKVKLDQAGNGNNYSPVHSGIGSIASFLNGNIGNALVSSLAGQQPVQNVATSPPPPSQFPSPNDYMHYLLANSQSQTHMSVPHYKEQSTSDLVQTYQEQMGSASTQTSTTGNQILSKLALGSILDDVDFDNLSNLLSFGSIEKMVEKVNKFDKLKCIPRILCQMVAKRHEDEKTTTTTTPKPGKASRKQDVDKSDDEKKDTEENDTQEDSDEDEDDDNDEESDVTEKPKGSGRQGRIFKIQGADTALEQFVNFLDLMQMKDWSLYPYLQGAYQGSQVGRTEECASRFATCPFSDEQLVYYFNNYNGGFFQSI